MSDKKTYSEKLRDPRWQQKRLEILNRDGWRCKMCGDSENTLHVHHKRYIWGREPWEAPDESLVTLCEPCHDNEYEMSGALHDLRAIVADRLCCSEVRQLTQLILDNCPVKDWGKDDQEGFHALRIASKSAQKALLSQCNYWGLH